MAKAKQFELTAELSAKLQQWNELSTQLSALKQQEFALRQELVSKIGTASKLEGSETFDMGNGWKLCLKKTQNYTLINVDHQTEKLLAAIAEKLQRQDIASTLVKWTPEMSKTTYNSLLPLLEGNDELKAVLSAALTIKPGAPSIEIVPPETKAS